MNGEYDRTFPCSTNPLPFRVNVLFVAGTRTYTWGLPTWFSHLPHPQSLVRCRAHCAEYGGECVSWQQMHANGELDFDFCFWRNLTRFLNYIPVSQRKGEIERQDASYCKNAWHYNLTACLLARKIILLVCDPLDRLERPRGLGIRIDVGSRRARTVSLS